MKNTSQNGVARYYSRVGSWLGYNLVMGRSQHAGYWTKTTKNEREAQKNYLEHIAKMLALKSNEKVLDAGSGQGYAARFLARKTGATVTGITITPREVRVSEKLSKNMPNSPKFILGDYSATNFPDGYFDVVYTTETLSHAKDMAKTMKEFYRILKPGGRLYLFDYEIDTNDMPPDEEALVAFLEKYAGGYGIRQQTPGTIATCLKNAGFKNVTETDWSKETKPTYDRLRCLARPFAWIKPSSQLAPYFVNAVMASHGYSSLYESEKFRYIVYASTKPKGARK